MQSLYSDKYRDSGLLILRVGIGIMFIGHGYPKVIGGPEKWASLGGAMQTFGVDFFPVFWGFLAAFAEFAGGALLVIGLLTRPACFFLLVTMIVAAAMHISKGHPFMNYAHSVEASILFLSLIFIGPGKYSVDEKMGGRKKTSEVGTNVSKGST